MRVGQKKKKSADKDGFDKLVELAKSLHTLQVQSCALIRPLVDDYCMHPNMVSENDLGHCFDSILDVACCKEGKVLFDKLCAAFAPKYPECVKDYKGFYIEMWGEDEIRHTRVPNHEGGKRGKNTPLTHRYRRKPVKRDRI